tara:strand:+ start:51 stop:320 length:270 start_codon:yes stop_codon:yes gene_type:complete
MTKKPKQERIAPNAVREGNWVLVTNPTCMHCGNGSSSRVDFIKYWLWQGGGLIDQIFPMMSIAERETMISGTHAYCWKEMFGDEEEADN